MAREGYLGFWRARVCGGVTSRGMRGWGGSQGHEGQCSGRGG